MASIEMFNIITTAQIYEQTNKMLSPWLLWIYSLHGLIFLTLGRTSILRIFFTTFLHSIYIINYLIGIHFLELYAENEALDAHVLQTCRTIYIILDAIKLLWYFQHSDSLNRTIYKLGIHDQLIEEKHINHTFGKHRIWIVFVITYIFARMFYLSSQSSEKLTGFYWILPVMKDAVELDFMVLLLNRARDYFCIFNRRMLKCYYHTVNCIKLETCMDAVTKDEIIIEHLKKIIISIKKLSTSHHRTVLLANEFNNILSFSAGLTLVKNIVDIVHESYVTHTDWSRKFQFMSLDSSTSWLLYSIALTSCILFFWSSLSEEANKTSVMLHDIWNICSKYKIHKELLHMQHISMRFQVSKLKLTAHGFFPFNRTFLHTVLASAATYVVILIQLKNK